LIIRSSISKTGLSCITFTTTTNTTIALLFLRFLLLKLCSPGLRRSYLSDRLALKCQASLGRSILEEITVTHLARGGSGGGGGGGEGNAAKPVLEMDDRKVPAHI
jgi:hypothetical protein